MDRTQTVGAVLGYAVGVSVAYPDRSFTVTAAMAGITLLAIGSDGGGPE